MMETMAFCVAPCTVRLPLASSSRLSSCWSRSCLGLRSSVPALDSNATSSPFVVECSSRPQKKCTAHHNKSRPKKHNPYDKNRKPPQYPRPTTAPPIFLLDSSDPLPSEAPPAP